MKACEFSYLTFLLISFAANAQAPSPAFNVTKTSGCAPLAVTFIDQSTGNPKYWNWDLGNGQLSTQQNPVAVYSQPGVYSVTLVVTNQDGTSGITKTNLITVSPSPIVTFVSDIQLGCSPVVIQFTDHTTDPSGSLASWNWDFGDGGSSNLQNPSHEFDTTGFYTITLSVTNSAGCTGHGTANRYIRIVPGVIADFAFDSIQPCKAPYSASIFNYSSGPGTLSYLWNLGNGTTDTSFTPKPVYASPGNYNVNLQVVSQFGCRDSVTKTVSLNNNDSSKFSTIEKGCVNTEIHFVNNSSPAPLSYQWDFGNGILVTEPNPVKIYTTPGSYPVKLINQFQSCKDSITQIVTITNPPNAAFASNDTLGCQSPFTAQFQNSTPDGVSWLWQFGDGSTSTAQNPSHQYTQLGNFNVSLVATNANGCTDTLTKPAFVKIQTINLQITNFHGGCAPFTFTPITNLTAANQVVSYSWDFGVPGAVTNQPNPSFTYTALGTYTVKLTVKTQTGCVATFSGSISMTTPVVPDFSFQPDTGCNSATIHFQNLSTPAGNAWKWDFGDGKTSMLENPEHSFKDTGTYVIHLTVSSGSCNTVISKTVTITKLQAIADFEATPDCTRSLTYDFSNQSVGDLSGAPLHYHWNFGDGTNDTTINPVHAYQSPGLYLATLIVNQGNCQDTASVNINAINPTGQFIVSKTGLCREEHFAIKAIDDTSVISQYEWTIGASPPFVGGNSIDTSLTNVGTYSITLTETDVNGCKKSLNQPITINVSGPAANFDTAALIVCRNSLVKFNDLSTSTVAISSWTWNFGDHAIQTFNAAPFSHTYMDTGWHSVKLTVQDANGCIDSLFKDSAVYVDGVFASFVTQSQTICPGASVKFIDSSSGNNIHYSWNFGDGSFDSTVSPTHIYSGTDSVYSVSLVVTDMKGCKDTANRTNYLHVQSPKAAFIVNDTASTCPPLESLFTFQGQGYQSFYWDFGDGSPFSNQKDPRHFYNDYGTFTVKLFLVGAGGCIDSAQRNINLYNPFANSHIDFTPSTTCNSVVTTFDVTTPPATRFFFYFGDGIVDSSQQKHFDHNYQTPGYYKPYLVLKDNYDCQTGIGSRGTITVLGAVPLFNIDKKAFCDSGQVFLTNYTIANDTVVSMIWNFNDGTTTTDKNPSHSFTKPGLYPVVLTVQTAHGCISSRADTVNIYATPHPTIVGSDTICIHDQAKFDGTLVYPDSLVTWNWDFGDGRHSTTQNNTLVYDKPGNYLITLQTVNKLGCADSASLSLFVAPLPSITTRDLNIVLGTGNYLPVNYSSGISTYHWNPTANLSCSDCAIPFASPKQTTQYKITVVDSNHCVASASLMVNVSCTEKNYFVPNTFSPNGDGMNDVFYPRGNGITRVQSMQIFNRWGQKVFERKEFMANDPSAGWDGTFNGKPLPPDVYVYIVEFVCENSAIVPFKGNVMLVR